MHVRHDTEYVLPKSLRLRLSAKRTAYLPLDVDLFLSL